MAADVAKAESGGRPDAIDTNGGASTDRGLWQVNGKFWPGKIDGHPMSTYRIEWNAKAAIKISRDGHDWSPWVSVSRGRETGQCP